MLISNEIEAGEIDLGYLEALIGDARVILEVGSNDGEHTHKLLTAFPNASVCAFEPDPRAIAKFRRNIADPRARLFECAVGARTGSAQFHVSSGSDDPAAGIAPDWDRSGSLRAPKTHLQVWPGVKFERTMTVETTTLDEFCRQQDLDIIDLIWADTQGAEGDLIAGGEHTLMRTRYLYTEYSNDEWYEGQITLAQILEALPHFKVVKRFAIDVLLENQALKKRDGKLSKWGKRLRGALFS